MFINIILFLFVFWVIGSAIWLLSQKAQNWTINKTSILRNNFYLFIFWILSGVFLTVIFNDTYGITYGVILLGGMIIQVVVNFILSLISLVKKNGNAKYHFLIILLIALIGYPACLGGGWLLSLIQR